MDSLLAEFTGLSVNDHLGIHSRGSNIASTCTQKLFWPCSCSCQTTTDLARGLIQRIHSSASYAVTGAPSLRLDALLVSRLDAVYY